LHQLGSRTIPVRAGDYFIVDLGSFHRYTENRDFEIVNCLFAPEYVDPSLRGCRSLSALLTGRLGGRAPVSAVDRIYHDDSGHIESLIRDMEGEYARRDPGYLEMLRCRLMEILIHAARIPSEDDGSKSHPAAAAMTEYIHGTLNMPLSLPALSSRLGYTPQYLSWLFRKETGMSLSEYLSRARIEKSCDLLAHSRLSISAVAQEVGYADPKHFNAVFRRYMGMPPREFRARAQGK
jgi:AraC-like DNA-binding protein